MLCAKWNRWGLIAIAIVLGSHSMVWGQLPAPPTMPTTGNVQPPQFRPLTEADVQDDLAQVKAAAAAIDQRFATAGPSAEGWKEYLSWAAFEAELQKRKPDQAVLGDVYKKLASGYEGLELKWFADLRSALGNYLFVASAAGSPDLASAVKQHIDDLSRDYDGIKGTGSQPASEQYAKIADDARWLEVARQAPELVKEVRDRLSGPNFALHIGKELVDLGVGGPIDDTAPIDDVILGTTVHGTGRTIGETHAVLNTDPATASNFATFDAVLQAVNHSNNVGRNGPVCLYTTGETGLAACKRFWFDAAGIHVYPAAASAQAHTTINNIVSIKGRKLVENIAWRRADKQKCEAEAIASQHAAARLGAGRRPGQSARAERQ